MTTTHRCSPIHGLLTFALGAALLAGCSSKEKEGATGELTATGSVSVAEADVKTDAPKDACKAPNPLKLQRTGTESGACVALPEGWKGGNATLDQASWGSQQILTDKGVYAGVLSFKRETLEKHAPAIETMATDASVELVSRGELPGRPFSNHVHTRSKSSGTEQLNTYVQFGSFVFFCSASGAKGATAALELCKSITTFGPAPVIATDGNEPPADAAPATSSAAAAEPTGASALEGDYTWFSSDGSGGSGKLKAKGDDFVINYSGSSGNGVVNCKPGKKEKSYNCSWSDPSGSGGVSFTVNAKGNLDGYWTGSGGGGGWTFNRAKAK